MKMGERRAVSFALAILVTASCMFCTGVSSVPVNDPAPAPDTDCIYVPTNLYKYDATGSTYDKNENCNNPKNVAINSATLSAAQAAQPRMGSKQIRALSFDWAYTTAGKNYGGDFNRYHAPGQNAVFTGLVESTLNNGNLVWNSGSERGTPYQYMAADLFRTGSEAAPAYRSDFSVDFPLEKEKDGQKYTGYYSFDSASQRAVLNQSTGKMDIRKQNIPSSSAQYSPFYSSDDVSNIALANNANQLVSFGMDMNMQFTVPDNGQVYNYATGEFEDMQFSFSGDDDVWIFVDGKLILDMGGIHQQVMGRIDFTQGTYSVWDYQNTNIDGSEKIPGQWQDPTSSSHYYQKNISDSSIKFNTKSSTPHTLTLYYLERGAGMSNFRMRCNLQQSSSFEVGKQLVGKKATEDNKSYTFQVSSSSDGSTFVPMKNQPYEIYNISGGTYVTSSTTGDNSEVTLGSGQKAVFRYRVSGNSPDASSFAGQKIRFTELNEEEYDTTYQLADGTVASGKTAIITAPPDTDSAQRESAVFTNRLSDTITSPQKTAVQTNNANRTYDITLKTSTADNSTAAVFTPVLASQVTENGEYYLNNDKSQRITWKNGQWFDSSGKEMSPQPTTVYHLDADAQTTVPISNATVLDTIDPRFEVVDDSGSPLPNGATIITNGDGTKATLSVPQNDPAYVTWTGQTIPVDKTGNTPTWEQTIHVRAKSEFIGGNDIPTNVPKWSYVLFKNISGGDVYKYFNSPTVNVPIRFFIGNEVQTIFLGEQVPTVTLKPYTKKDDGTTVTGDGMFCGKDSTGTFRYQWKDKNGNELNGATDEVFPGSQIPTDTTHYTLTAIFTPVNNGSASQQTQGGDPAAALSKGAMYTVNVVKGELDLTKFMNAQYPVYDPDPDIPVKPQQSFFLKITRSDTQGGVIKETFFEVITPDDINSGKEKKITGLKKGVYTVAEETGGTTQAWRYSQTDLIDNDIATTADFTSKANDGIVFVGREVPNAMPQKYPKAYFGAAKGNGIVAENPATVTFINELNNFHWAGDVTVAVNTVRP